MEDMRNDCKISDGILNRKEAYRKPNNKLEENCKIELKGRGYDGVDWINLTQDRIIGTR
jgi:hypothetical protein